MKKFNISKRLVIAVCVIVLAAVAAATGGVIAKYVKQVKQEQNPTTAKAFYFTSDYLKASSESRTYYLGSTTTSVSFDVRNFKDALNVSEVNTTYTVKIASNDTSFTVAASNGQEISNKNEFTLEAAAGTQITHKITLEELKSGNTYTVTVTANGGYTKTLTAVFSIDKVKSGFYYNIADEGEYLLLTVWTENYTKGTVTIEVPENLIPDVTDDLLNINNYNTEQGTYTAFTVTDTTSFADSTNASRSYRFFKDGNKYTSATFKVKMGDATATVSSIP